MPATREDVAVRARAEGEIVGIQPVGYIMVRRLCRQDAVFAPAQCPVGNLLLGITRGIEPLHSQFVHCG